MAYQPKSYRKFVATAATATLVASAVAPAAAAGFTDVSDNYKEAVDFVVSKGAKGLTETRFGVSENIKRVDAAVLLANVLELDTDKAPAAGFTDVPARAQGAVNALKAAGITNGKSDTKFGANDLITRGELAIWIQKGFGLEGKADFKFTDVGSRYTEAVAALVANKITQGKSETQFGTADNAKRGDYAIFLHRAANVDATPEAPEVVEVSALNGTQLLVKFSQEVDATTAETEANYLIKKNGAAAPLTTADYTAKVQEDGKSVIITLATPIPNDEVAVFSITVEDILLKGSLTDKFPVFTSTVTVSDKVAPTVASVSAKTAGTEADTLYVTFSEPVVQPTVKVNGVTRTIILADDGLSGTVTNLSLETGKTHSVEFVNLTDLSNNVTANESKTFTVTVDTTAPTYSISTVSDKRIKLTFDKKMDVDSVIAGVVLKKEDLNDLTKDTHYRVTESTVASEKGKVFNVDLIGGGFDPYASKSSYDFTLMTNAHVKDSLGNKAAATSKVVKLTKDTVKPKLTSIQYLKNSSGRVTTLLLKYDEVIDGVPGTITDLTAKNVTTGATVNILGTAPTASVLDDGQTVRINIDTNTATEIKSGKLEIEVAAGYVNDIASSPNASSAFKGTVDFGAGSSASLKVKDVTRTGTNEFKVEFDAAVTYASATNPANYTINGVALPADTTFAFDTTNQDNVTITLPAQFVKADDTGAVLRVQNVETATGTKVAANQKVISIEDNAGPVIVKANSSINSNGTLTLGFDERVATIASGLTSADILADLRIFLNGEEVTVDSTATGGAETVVVTDGTGADAGKYVLTFNTTFESNAATGANADGDYIEYFDVNGNGVYDANTDILVKRAVNVTNDEIAAYTVANTLNLNRVANITIGTADTTSSIVDLSAAQNVILNKQSVVIK